MGRMFPLVLSLEKCQVQCCFFSANRIMVRYVGLWQASSVFSSFKKAEKDCLKAIVLFQALISKKSSSSKSSLKYFIV